MPFDPEITGTNRFAFAAAGAAAPGSCSSPRTGRLARQFSYGARHRSKLCRQGMYDMATIRALALEAVYGEMRSSFGTSSPSGRTV